MLPTTTAAIPMAAVLVGTGYRCPPGVLESTCCGVVLVIYNKGSAFHAAKFNLLYRYHSIYKISSE